MADTTCGWCGIHTHMTLLAKTTIGTEQDDFASIDQHAHTCDHCGRITIATILDGTSYTPTQPNPQRFEGDHGYVFVEWTPQHTPHTTYPDVPEHIAAAATEATLCLSVSAHRAVGGLARAVIEATAKDKGITVRGIHPKIEGLEAAGHIRPSITATAHEIRLFGNDMAHGDFTDPITHDQAADTIALMSELLQEVYQGPARLARVTADREAKKTTT